VLLGVAFIDFLVDMFRERKLNWIVRTFVAYIIILILSFGIKWGISQIPLATPAISYVENYDTNVTSNKLGVAAEHKEYYADLMETRSPREAGYSFWDTMWGYNSIPTPAVLFMSFTGCYMWMALYSGLIYYVLMAGAYMAMIINIIVKWIKDKRQLGRDIKIVSSIIMCIVTVAIVLIYCWNNTYQPQGRYCLTIPLVIGYACSQYGNILEDRFTTKMIYLCAFLGVWSYIVYGLMAMYSQGCLMI
jgi:hypothetical protein